MLKNASPVISKFIQDHPNEMEYHLNFNDEEKILIKFEKLFQEETVYFYEDELPTCQRITKSLQIKNCPFYLKPNSLCDTNEAINFFNSRFNNPDNDNDNDLLKRGVELNRKSFVNFLKKQEFQTFRISTNKNKYQCNIKYCYK